GNLAANDLGSRDGGNVWSLASGPKRGSATVHSNGTYSYRANWHFHGTDSFTYQIEDANGDVSTATVTITVRSVNDVPVAVADTAATTRNQPVSGNLTANDLFSGDGGNYVSLVTAPANGTATVNPNGTYTYTPRLNYAGTDVFTYRLRDLDGDVSSAKVTIIVR
ncbi:MAG: cadherin-like domain-containing protein, partial [Limisphaerales bacterium]